MQLPVNPVNCVIAGGGAAGMMLGYLLARGRQRQGSRKHADFFRIFAVIRFP